ncbi:MAG: stage V sporulation protein T [Clostridiaceae bacterium]|nr:stage V sporulation protein T [Clostridiaceae bacterium]
MKATGIVRRIDDLGRVVIPKEIRRTMRIREGDPLEIFTDKDGEVIFKKYSPIGELGEFASTYAETLSKTVGVPVCITDKDNIIAVSGAPKKELSEKPISSDLEKIMQEKTTFVAKPNENKKVPLIEGMDKYVAGVVVPIIAEGDPIGSVVILNPEDGTPPGETEAKVAQSAAGFLGKQMES